MSHVRQQIREAIATACLNLTTTGARVFQSRVYPLARAELPGLLVHNDVETVTKITIESPALQQRNLRVIVRAVARAVDDLDDTLDTICKEVEVALAANAGVLAVAKTCSLTGIETGMDHSGDAPIGWAALLYDLEYYTYDNSPETAH